jgi:hypothetical protein
MAKNYEDMSIEELEALNLEMTMERKALLQRQRELYAVLDAKVSEVRLMEALERSGVDMDRIVIKPAGIESGEKVGGLGGVTEG